MAELCLSKQGGEMKASIALLFAALFLLNMIFLIKNGVALRHATEKGTAWALFFSGLGLCSAFFGFLISITGD
jgi:hypothetical protein